MNTNKRTKSIARKINNNTVLELLSAFILIDLLIAVLPAVFWCCSVESAINKNPDFSDARYFSSISRLERKMADDGTNDFAVSASYAKAKKEFEAAAENNEKLFLPIAPAKALLNETVYVCENQKGEEQYTYAGDFLTNTFSCLSIIITVEILILAWTFLTGAKKIRQRLRPLDELALKAEMLANTADFDQQTLEELERAINAISPTATVRLHTNNAETEQLEKAINGLLERMRESYRLQSRFVSDASHELRTPISVLQGYVNMLDRWGKDDENILDESIEAIKSETEHMKRLVEQLLFLARGDSGKTKLNMEAFSLNDMMQEVCEESIMIDKTHTYRYLPCDEPVTVTGDAAMLKQTARILIDNAAKYAKAGSVITLKTKRETKNNADGGPVSFSAFLIQDEGIGMTANDVSHIFERFYRSDPARTKDSGGTGLGLSIAKWIIDRHGGYFDVISREEIGTRITVCLPSRI